MDTAPAVAASPVGIGRSRSRFKTLPSVDIAALAVAFAGTILTGTARAQFVAPPPIPGFSIGAALLSQYDSNVQRLASDSGGGSWINEPLVFAGFDQTYGRQHLYASADAGRVLYAKKPVFNNKQQDYDYTQQDVSAGWHAKLPASIEAEVDVAHNAQLAHFADQIVVHRNVITRNDAKAEVDFTVANQWRLVTGVEGAHWRNSSGFDEPSNLNLTVFEAGVRYLTGLENQVDLLAYTSHATYPDVQASALVSPYRDRGADLRVKWKFSGASTVYGRAGYLKRDYDLASFRNFSGAAYDMTYLWTPTVRTSLAFLVLRQTGAKTDNQYLSAVTRTYRLTPKYAVTAKIAVDADFELDQVDYLVVANAPARNDSVHAARIGVSWSPRDWILVKAGQTWEQRASNQPGFDYLDRITSLLLQATF